jgi:hypothetical protein
LPPKGISREKSWRASQSTCGRQKADGRKCLHHRSWQRPGRTRIRDDLDELSQTFATRLGNDPQLGQMCPQCVGELRALTDQQTPCPMHGHCRLLVFGLNGHEPHRWPGNGFANRCRISRIVLAPFDVGLHVNRRDQPNGMTEFGQLAPPVVCCRARFHANEARLDLRKKRDHLLATKLPNDNNLALFVDAMNLENILGEIDSDGLNLRVDAPSRVSLSKCHHKILVSERKRASSTASD